MVGAMVIVLLAGVVLVMVVAVVLIAVGAADSTVVNVIVVVGEPGKVMAVGGPGEVMAVADVATINVESTEWFLCQSLLESFPRAEKVRAIASRA